METLPRHVEVGESVLVHQLYDSAKFLEVHDTWKGNGWSDSEAQAASRLEKLGIPRKTRQAGTL